MRRQLRQGQPGGNPRFQGVFPHPGPALLGKASLHQRPVQGFVAFIAADVALNTPHQADVAVSQVQKMLNSLARPWVGVSADPGAFELGDAPVQSQHRGSRELEELLQLLAHGSRSDHQDPVHLLLAEEIQILDFPGTAVLTVAEQYGIPPVVGRIFHHPGQLPKEGVGDVRYEQADHRRTPHTQSPG